MVMCAAHRLRSGADLVARARARFRGPEARTASWGYAVATVSFTKPDGPPFRMSALAIGAPDKDGTWLLSAVHYLSL